MTTQFGLKAKITKLPQLKGINLKQERIKGHTVSPVTFYWPIDQDGIYTNNQFFEVANGYYVDNVPSLIPDGCYEDGVRIIKANATLNSFCELSSSGNLLASFQSSLDSSSSILPLSSGLLTISAQVRGDSNIVTEGKLSASSGTDITAISFIKVIAAKGTMYYGSSRLDSTSSLFARYSSVYDAEADLKGFSDVTAAVSKVKHINASLLSETTLKSLSTKITTTKGNLISNSRMNIPAHSLLGTSARMDSDTNLVSLNSKDSFVNLVLDGDSLLKSNAKLTLGGSSVMSGKSSITPSASYSTYTSSEMSGVSQLTSSNYIGSGLAIFGVGSGPIGGLSRFSFLQTLTLKGDVDFRVEDEITHPSGPTFDPSINNTLSVKSSGGNSYRITYPTPFGTIIQREYNPHQGLQKLWETESFSRAVISVSPHAHSRIITATYPKTSIPLGGSLLTLWQGNNGTSKLFELEEGNFHSTASNSMGQIYAGRNDGALIKYDTSGEVIWANTDLMTDLITSIAVRKDQNILVGSGKTIRCISPNNVLLWTYNLPVDRPHSVREIITDKENVTYAITNDWLYKIRSTGTLMWDTSIYRNDGYRSISVDKDHQLYILSQDTSSSTNPIFIIRKTDSNGNLRWQKTFDEPTFGYLHSIRVLYDLPGISPHLWT